MKKTSLPSKPKPKTESFPINDDALVMYLYDAGDSHRNFVRMDFNSQFFIGK